MTKNNSKSTTLLISIYSWDWETVKPYNFVDPKEDICEVQIKNIDDMTILTHRLGVKARYKKPTDKNWYTYRAMTKRLFKKGNRRKSSSLGSGILFHYRLDHYNFIIEGKIVEVEAASLAEAYELSKQIIYEMKQLIDSD